jgi:uncharacterized protein YecE (DUF72 family)
MVAPAAQCRIGTSGFHYDHWKQVFYPEGLARKHWFAHYAAHFDTLEVNNTFYRVPERSTFETWAKQTPPGFIYALKFSRFGTHNKKLLTPRQTLTYFLQRAEPLLAHVDPILVQLPPHWRANPQRLDEFLAAAPRRQRWAVEMRAESWLNDEVYAVLRRHNAALCIHDIIPDHPRLLTADWTYIRFHGAGARYAGSYADEQLRDWARVIRRCLRRGIDVFAYFNNDQHGNAITNALKLKEMLQMSAPGQAPIRRPAAPRARRRRTATR